MRIGCRLTLLFLTCLTVVCTAQIPACAKFIPRVNVRAEKDGTAFILINGRSAVHVMTPNGSLSPIQRATIAAERLNALVQKGLDPQVIAYKKAGHSARIVIGDSLMMVATSAEARAHATTSPKLAESWVGNLQKLLSLPPLTVSPSSLVVPFGETRSAEIECALSTPIQVESSNPSLVTLDFQKKPGYVVITGLSIGDATVTFKCEEYSATMAVAVRKYAASAAKETRRATVTGWNCPASLIVPAARSAACQAVYLEVGARITILVAQSPTENLTPGQRVKVPVQVGAAGPGYLPIRFSVPVEVQNRQLPPVPISQIMYSNNPERLAKYQSLFTGRLDSTTETTRLLYHHQNMTNRKVGFVIDVVNPSASPAALHVIEGIAEPMLDTVVVGYLAGLEFMQNHRSCLGRVYDIPPETRQVLVSQSLGHEYTASGIMELRLLSGEPLLVRVTAEPEDQRAAEDSYEMPVPARGIDPRQIALSDHVYPNPVQDYDVTYTIGKAWVFLRLGKDPLKHATQDMQLYGNYGVTYEIKARLENPLSAPVTAELVFEATAGPASGIFYVDGNMVRVKYLTPPSEFTLGRVTVPAGKTRVVSIRTIPLSGSAYPATLIIRPAGALPSNVGGR